MPEPTADWRYPEEVAMAEIVVVVETGMGVEYTVDDVVGVQPLVAQ